MKKRIGIIGYGNMGSAIADTIKSQYTVYVFDKDESKTVNLYGLERAKSVQNLAEGVDSVVLAVKPQDFDSLLSELKGFIKDKLIISIAAGITTSYIQKKLERARVVRAMPNLPAQIGKGMTCLIKGKYALDRDLLFSEKVFNNLGKTLVLNNEAMLNAATAVSGSGPGFFFGLAIGKGHEEVTKFAKKVFLPKLEEAAYKEGFNKRQAHILSTTTTAGSLAMLAIPGNSAETLRIKVTSPNGTTEAGLIKLQNNPDNLSKAVKAAKKRAEELSKEE